MARRKKFNNENAARSFAKKVGGRFNDLTGIEDAKSRYSVTYEPNEKTRAHGQPKVDFCPEENRDFGYSNDFWN